MATPIVNDDVAVAVPMIQMVPTVELKELGLDIIARVKKGDKAKDHADHLYLSAGLQLIEAKRRTNNFSAFLRDHCGGLSRSRAHELIKIAEGKGEEVQSKNRERDRRRRAKAASVREPRTPPVIGSVSERALAEFKVAVDTWLAKMDDDAKRAAVEYVTERAAR